MKKIVIPGLLAATALAVIGLYLVRTPQAPETPQSASRPEKTPVNLNLGIINFPTMGFFYLAEDKGFFRDEGVAVNIKTISDPNQLIPTLASKQIDLMISSADFSTIIKESGVDAPQVMIIDTSNGADGLLATKDIRNFADLKGKEVRVPLGYPSHFLFRYAARQNGLKDGDLKIADMAPDQVGAAFLAGQIDYGMTWEPWLSKGTERADGKVLLSSRDYPEIILDTLVARREVLEQERPAVKAFIRAYFKAVDYWRANPEEASKVMAEKLNLPTSDFEATMQNLRPFDYQANKAKFSATGAKSLSGIEQSAVEIFRADGIIKSQIDPATLIDASLINSLYEQD